MELVLSTDLEKDNWVSGGCTDSLASRDEMCFPPNLFALYDLNLQCTKLSIGIIMPLSNRDIVILTVRID